MDFEIKPISIGKRNHFFGYYDINPFSMDGKYHLALETDFQNHRPVFGESASVGLVECETGIFHPLARTRAFNFQQGSMLNWIRLNNREQFCYNDLQNGRLVTVIMNPKTGEQIIRQGAVSGMAENSTVAASLNYLRNFQCRPVVGYDAGQKGLPEKTIDSDDGLYVMDLAMGTRKLIVSMDRIAAHLPAAEVQKGWMWFDHTVFNPAGTRIMFFVRVLRKDGSGWYSSLWTVNTDGTDLRNHLDYTHFISHWDWYDDEHLLVSAEIDNKCTFYFFNVFENRFEPFYSDLLPQDGHACFSPDRQWLICDAYPTPKDPRSELMLIHLADGRRYSVGFFDAPLLYRGDIRCDLHPRWSADSTRFTFDSVHGPYRQIYQGYL